MGWGAESVSAHVPRPAAGAEIAAVASFYAAVPDEAERTLSNICPVVASYGGRDRLFGGHGSRLESALTALDVPHDVKTYPECRAGATTPGALAGPARAHVGLQR